MIKIFGWSAGLWVLGVVMLIGIAAHHVLSHWFTFAWMTTLFVALPFGWHWLRAVQGDRLRRSARRCRRGQGVVEADAAPRGQQERDPDVRRLRLLRREGLDRRHAARGLRA